MMMFVLSNGIADGVICSINIRVDDGTVYSNSKLDWGSLIFPIVKLHLTKLKPWFVVQIFFGFKLGLILNQKNVVTL